MNRNELQELLELLIVRAIEQIKHGQYDQALGTLEEVQYRLQQYVYGDR
jgi:hypothetical protein